jgi:putative DNA primase/helicase
MSAAIKAEVDSSNLVTSGGEAYRVTKGVINNVIAAMSGEHLIEDDGMGQPKWLGTASVGPLLAFENGLLNLDSYLAGHRALNPLTPEWFSAVLFPYGYEPNAQAARWLEFINEVLEGDQERINLLQEWFGYLLTPDTSLHKFLVLEGDGANGKSVVLEVLGAMLGEKNISHVPLGMFGERFQLTPTLAKLANIAPEADEGESPNIGTLKQFTGGDRMYFDRKGVPGIQAKPTARLVVATNNPPSFADLSAGLWRRMLLIPFRVTIAPEKQDRELARKLREELPGIVNWALEGLRRLRQQNRFTEPAVSVEALAEYRSENNPAGLFLADCVESAVEAVVHSDVLYGAYKAYCKANGYTTTLNGKQFGKEVKRRFPLALRTRLTRDGQRPWAYAGLKLTATMEASLAALAA